MKGKIDNPMCIRFQKTLEDQFFQVNAPHYGMIVMTQNHSKVYPTEEKIDALKIKDGNLYVYEEGKSAPWIFNLEGQEISHLEESGNSLFSEVKMKVKQLIKHR